MSQKETQWYLWQRNCIWQPDLTMLWCQWASEVHWKSQRLWSVYTLTQSQMTLESKVRQKGFFQTSLKAIQTQWILAECGTSRTKSAFQLTILLPKRGNQPGCRRLKLFFDSHAFWLYAAFKFTGKIMHTVLLPFPHSPGVRLFEFLLMPSRLLPTHLPSCQENKDFFTSTWNMDVDRISQAFTFKQAHYPN